MPSMYPPVVDSVQRMNSRQFTKAPSIPECNPSINSKSNCNMNSNMTMNANPSRYSPYESILVDRLRHQMEYYFSPANLLKDTFLVDVLKKHDGSVPIDVIARFPKIRALFSMARNGIGSDQVNITASEPAELTWLVRAVQTSDRITLSDDETLICPSFVTRHPNTPPPPPPHHLGPDDSMASPAWSLSSDSGVPIHTVTFYPPHFQWQPPISHFYYHPGMIPFHTIPAYHDEYKGLTNPQPQPQLNQAQLHMNPKPTVDADKYANASSNQLEWIVETSKDKRGKKRPTRRGGSSQLNQMKAASSTQALSSNSNSVTSVISLSPTPTSDGSKTKHEDLASLPSLSSSPSLTPSNRRRRPSHRRSRRTKSDSVVNVLESDFPALDGSSTVQCPLQSCNNWATVVKSSGNVHKHHVDHDALNRL